MSTLTLLAAALIGAGCGSSPRTESGTSGGGSAPHLSKAVRFAECMRDHGVAKFPDPDPNGELTIDGAVNGTGIDPDGAAWKQAIKACKDLQPAGFKGRKRTPEQQSQGLKFAQCIRKNGVPDFPDPVEGQPLVNTNLIPSTNTDAGMTALNAAMQKCSDLGPQQ
jgi:hypothetical protein